MGLSRPWLGFLPIVSVLFCVDMYHAGLDRVNRVDGRRYFQQTKQDERRKTGGLPNTESVKGGWKRPFTLTRKHKKHGFKVHRMTH